jgi:hypothetical protein
VSGNPRSTSRRRLRTLAAGALAAALLVTPLALTSGAEAAGSQRALKKQPAGATVFRLSSFNLLGAGHTAPGGDRPGWASGSTRMEWTVQILEQNSIDVVGFQEMQPPQFSKFDELAGQRFGIFPGDQMTTAAMANSIAWRQDQFTLLRTETIQIPYFDGNLIRMPYVLLQDKETGQQGWFFNTHNPADAHGPAQKWRDRAVKKEIDLVNDLREQYPDVPVFVTGDMNDREKFFCPITSSTELLAANGGSTADGVCTMPVPSRVDWVLGTSDTSFTGYNALKDELVAKTTDHYVILADANIPAPAVQETPVTRVLALSVDGLRPSAVRRAGEAGAPALHRMMREGASTLNARTEVERTTTLPNTIGMLTGRRVKVTVGGHGVKGDRDNGGTVQSTAGRYVSSVFDLVHNFGRSTALFSSSPRTAMIDRSWDEINGGTDPYGLDDGRDKIDDYVSTADDHELVDRLVAMLGSTPRTFTMAQLSLLDDAGRTYGYSSPQYKAALTEVDGMVGRILAAVDSSPKLAGHTLVVLTAGAGGRDHSNADRTLRSNFRVPFLVRGPGVVSGADLYDLNPDYQDPGKIQPTYSGPQPIRNGMLANLATAALRLPRIPGSGMNASQDLNVFVGGPAAQ